MKIEIYSRDNCSWCDKAKTLLSIKNINYTEYKMGYNITREEVLEKFPDAKTVPIIVVDGIWKGGYTELEMMIRSEENEPDAPNQNHDV